ncbi:helix-turn-helix transcriptional regulator [Streptomonospora nanhaiensis]|uniref:Transcriptional regulator with XRE-family HTH domain n=1 Tax=Streptomonospora nanhaiensis TaxID=1323731 RepID=A0A853BTJ2_9ACTN|nr:helix-turn-helix transcriptional regulator [Streptomonospora nanhaiensis]MBX9386887.1 helix-turn-helix domain-containing protein [Streptomonospora nanhaiensis]NYI98045.1 transcriptional regulator with XRE-family HTH domain [Streptomonospora nanhaiensis]
MAETLPALLKRQRAGFGWTQARLAQELCAASGRPTVTRQEVYRWESGRRIPKFWLPHLATVLQIPRTELERSIASAKEKSAALDDFFPRGKARQRQLCPPRGRLGGGDADDLSSRVHALRLADDVLPGKDLIRPALRELKTAVRRTENGFSSETAERSFLVPLGELAQIAGWIASDAGRQGVAERVYRLGIAAARQAGDAALAAQIAGCLAYQWSNNGRESEGVALAEAALAEAGPAAPPRARALFWDRVAWARTMTGDAQGAMRALGEAESALARHRDEAEPAWLYWVDEGELQIMAARVHTELRRPLRAVPLLTEVLARYDTTHTREHALYLSWLAVAYADANEPEEAAAVARRMLAMSANLGSHRTSRRGRAVLTALHPFHDVPEVAEVLETVHAEYRNTAKGAH